MARRPGHPYEQGFDLRMWPQRLSQPLKWKRPRMIFVNSMSDLFHERIPDAFIREVFASMEEADWHTFQILTKRPERLVELADALPWPSNVWMGVSIENRRFVSRANLLREVPAAVRFISAEPLLGPLEGLDLSDIHWLIAGGESGPRARAAKPDGFASFAIDARTRRSRSSLSSGEDERRRPVGGSWMALSMASFRSIASSWPPSHGSEPERRQQIAAGRRCDRLQSRWPSPQA